MLADHEQLTFQFIKDVGRPVSTNHTDENVIKLVETFLAHNSVTKHPSGFIGKYLKYVITGILLGPTRKVISKETQYPSSQIPRCEQVVAVVIYSEPLFQLK